MNDVVNQVLIPPPIRPLSPPIQNLKLTAQGVLLCTAIFVSNSTNVADEIEFRLSWVSDDKF